MFSSELCDRWISHQPCLRNLKHSLYVWNEPVVFQNENQTSLIMKELLSSLSFNQANSVARLSALCICQNAFTGKTLLAKAYHVPIKAPDRNRRKSKLGELSWTARSVLPNRKEIRISPPGQACQNRMVTAGKTIRLNEFSPVILNKPGSHSIPPNPVTETGCDIIIKPVRAKITGRITPYTPPGDSSSDR